MYIPAADASHYWPVFDMERERGGGGGGNTGPPLPPQIVVSLHEEIVPLSPFPPPTIEASSISLFYTLFTYDVI